MSAGDLSSAGSDRSVGSRSQRLRPSGGYRELRSFRVSTIVYDATVDFCARFMNQRSRTVDQMVQAARSGRQNIAEGSRASATSSQTELRLVNVARASLDELLLDYEDFLRQRGLRQWAKDDREAQAVRVVGRAENRSDLSDRTDQSDRSVYARCLDHADSSVVANTIICLVHQTNYLLDQQIRTLERDFIHKGGYSEQLAVARIRHRQSKDRTDQSDPSDRLPPAPDCRLCGKSMMLRTARQGSRAGLQFWGCSTYPACKSTLPA
jgi:four helix bundle suffix protein